MVLATCLEQVEADVKLRSVSISHDEDGVRGFTRAQRDILQHLKGEHSAGSLERDVVLPKDVRAPRSVDLRDVLEAKAYWQPVRSAAAEHLLQLQGAPVAM